MGDLETDRFFYCLSDARYITDTAFCQFYPAAFRFGLVGQIFSDYFLQKKMMKAFYLFLLFIFPSFLFAQEVPQIRLVVVQFQHIYMHELVRLTTIDSVKITLVNKATSDTTIVYTNEDGYFYFECAAHDIYYVTAEKEGYQTSNCYPLKTNNTTPFYFHLVPIIEK